MNKIDYYMCRGSYKNCRNITVEEAYEILKTNPSAILLDVRSCQEYDEGHLCGSININVYHLNRCVEKIIEDKETTIIVYCQGDVRSGEAVEILCHKGYLDVYHICRGIKRDIKKCGF